MSNSALSLLMLIVQIALVGYTAYLAPKRSRKRLLSFFFYTVGSFALWLVYAILALYLDSATGSDFPGIGYLFVGFIAWCIGSVYFFLRINPESLQSK